MENRKKVMRFLIRSLMVLVAIALVAVAGIYWKLNQKSIYEVYFSPDKKFKLVLYSYHRIIAMPGSGSDAEGLLCLFNETTGTELSRCKVGIVREVEQVEWSATNVYIPLIANWELSVR